MGPSTIRLPRAMVNSACHQFIPLAIKPPASMYVGMQCAIEIHRAAKLYVLQSRRRTGTGARSALNSGLPATSAGSSAAASAASPGSRMGLRTNTTIEAAAVYSRSPRRHSPMRRFRAARWFASFVALTLLVLAAPMLPPAAAQAPGALVLGLDQEPPTLDPHASPSAVTYQIIASVTECLLYKAPDGKLLPWLAESWTPSKDGRSVAFKLRRDVKFHDGTPFNADAVKFNFDRIVDPKFKAGGSRAALAGYAGSKVLDEFSVQVSFETPFAPFLTYAASGPLSIVSPKAVRESGDLVHTRPIGTGQFMIKDYVAKDHTTMSRAAGDGGLEVHP